MARLRQLEGVICDYDEELANVKVSHFVGRCFKIISRRLQGGTTSV